MMRSAVMKAPRKLIIPAIAFIGILGNVAGDAAPIVLPPLAAMVFVKLGWHPVAGIAMAYAAALGGFAANLILGMSDALVLAFTAPAAELIDPNVQTNTAMNYYFFAAQMLAYFNWSNLGSIIAIKEANLLSGSNGVVLIVGIVILSSIVNLLIGSASAKWAILAYQEQLVARRRHLHQHPELSFEEHETVAHIEAELRARLKHARYEKLTPTSLVVVFDTRRPGPKLGLRADIDALGLQEDRPDLEFASTVPGKMHGCGHDAHTAVIMSACAWIDDNLDELTGEVHAVFQHAEETPPGNAKEMVATGYFEGFDFFYGFHFWATVPNPGLETELDYLVGYDAVLNDPARTELVRGLAEPLFDEVITEPAMLGGEDFAAFSRVAPATYVFIGASNKQFNSPHHSPAFGLDEASFAPALTLAVEIVKNGPKLA